MYVCVCNGITERQVREAVAEGAANLADLQRSLGIATNCGMCGDVASEILGEVRPAARPATPVVHFPRAG